MEVREVHPAPRPKSGQHEKISRKPEQPEPLKPESEGGDWFIPAKLVMVLGVGALAVVAVSLILLDAIVNG